MRESSGYLASGFRDVDGDADLAKLTACLGFLAGLPSFQAYKARSYQMMRLKPGQTVADLGCGLGFDLPELARRVRPGGRVVGLDASRRLLAQAREVAGGLEGVELVQGDILALGFPANTFDAVRVDRTLQHVTDPRQAIAEMRRVLRPGGWLVAAEPDWGTFVIDCQDVATSDLVAQRWRQGFRNPHIGRGLGRMLREEGLGEVAVEGFILLAQGLEAVDMVYDLCKTVEMLKEEEGRERERLAAWLEDLRRQDASAGVSASVTLFLACGHKV
ncbi:MAG: methyltransferase domain-containing protein [Desulfarculus sp.]|nr:methyltransferase domain-containing protein [Desulfarculus sp.]